jgi:hypothetical protein
MATPAFTVLRYDPARAFTADASETIEPGELVAIDGTGKAKLATAGTTGQAQAVGIAAHEAETGERLLVLPEATIYDSARTGLKGKVLYLSATTSGAYADTKPTTTNDLIQPIGTGAPQDKVIHLSIDPTAVTVP